MGRQVFTYRNVSAYWGLVFCALWCGIWMTGSVVGWRRQEITINDRLVTGADAVLPMLGFVGIGLGFCIFSVAMGHFVFNARVEVEGGRIRGFDRWGREVASGSLRGLSVTFPGPKGNVQQMRVQTQSGVLTIYGGINDFARLKRILRSRSDAPDARMPVSSYVPPKRTFTCRWGAHHLFSFLWLGIVGAMILVFVLSAKPDLGTALAFTVFFALFLAPGVWMQLKGWNETLTLGPDGLLSIDYLGRERLRVDLDEIYELEVIEGDEGDRFEIHTREGSVSNLSYFRDFDVLKAELRRLTAGRGRPG